MRRAALLAARQLYLLPTLTGFDSAQALARMCPAIATFPRAPAVHLVRAGAPVPAMRTQVWGQELQRQAIDLRSSCAFLKQVQSEVVLTDAPPSPKSIIAIHRRSGTTHFRKPPPGCSLQRFLKHLKH